MAVPVWVTNDVPTATDFNVWLTNTIAAVKSANESVTSSTTMQDDDHLFVSVAANSTYEVSCFLKYDGPTAADLKFQFLVPASAVFDFGVTRLQTGASDATSVALEYNLDSVFVNIGTIGSGTSAACHIRGTLTVAGTAGTFKLQWAQVTSDATSTRIFAKSHLVLHRIA